MATKLTLHLPKFGSRKGPTHYTSYRIPFDTAKLISRVARTASLDLTKKDKAGARNNAISQTEATVQIIEQAVKLFAVAQGVHHDPALKPSAHARESTLTKKGMAKALSKPRAKKSVKAATTVRKGPIAAKVSKPTKAKKAKAAKKGKRMPVLVTAPPPEGGTPTLALAPEPIPEPGKTTTNAPGEPLPNATENG